MADRVAIVGVWHETNSYASREATLEDFERFELVAGEELRAGNQGVNSVIGGFLDAHGFDVVPVFSAGAWPSGPCSQETFALVVDRLTTALRAHGPFSGVLVNLHGAMAVAGVPEVEGTVLDAVRSVVGDVPVAAVLDLHANVSAALAGQVDAMIAYDTYPHVDMGDRGREAAHLMRRMLAGERLVTTLGRIPMLTAPMGQATDAEPMRGLLRRAQARAAAAGLVRISLTPGFPYSDVASVGFSVFAVSSPEQAGDAARVVEETLVDVAAHEVEFTVEVHAPADAVRAVLADPVDGATVLVDVADNVGGGSSGDSAAILAELVAQGAAGAAVTIADAEVAALCHEQGVGSRVTCDLGGKTDDVHGPPLPVRDALVVAVSDGEYVSTTAYMRGRTFSLGRSALLDIQGVLVLVTELPVPPFHADQLRTVGVEPTEARYLTAKGAIAWRDAFEFAAREVLVEGPGACPVTIDRLERTHLPTALDPRH